MALHMANPHTNTCMLPCSPSTLCLNENKEQTLGTAHYSVGTHTLLVPLDFQMVNANFLHFQATQ